MQADGKHTWRSPLLWLCLFAGLAFGGGLFTFWYANGFGYMGSRPEACASCHVMRDVYNAYQAGDHARSATCVDCHLPQDFVGKWIGKAQAGLHHSYAFTFLDTPVAITATGRSKRWINNNCQQCHQNQVHNVISPPLADNAETLTCTSCHRHVGHAHN